MKTIMKLLVFMALATPVFAGRQVQNVELLSDVTATGAGKSFMAFGVKRTFQAEGETSAGSGSATIAVEVSNDCTNWITAGTITLTLSSSTSDDGFATDAAWRCVRGNVTAISGTDASVSLHMGQDLN